MWARIHKIDRVRPLADGGAIVLVEDERNLAAMSLVPSLSQLVAIARVVNAHRLLELRHGGKGEVRYCAYPSLPESLLDAVSRALAKKNEPQEDPEEPKPKKTTRKKAE